MKKLVTKLKTVKDKIIYKIAKKICDLMYRRVTYIPEKGLWVSTVVFPGNIMFTDGEDNATICGVTDVFRGTKKKVTSFEALHSVYINKASESGNIHRNVVKCAKGGYILKNAIDIEAKLLS